MNNDILFKILQLDSLTNFLHWKDRIRIHLYMLGKIEKITPKVNDAYHWIVTYGWESPLMKYGQDYLQYFQEPDSDLWLPVEDYLDLYYEKYPGLLTLTRF